MAAFGLYMLGAFGKTKAVEKERRLPFRLNRFAMNPLVALVLGFTVIIIPNLDPAKLGSLVLKHKPEHMFGVPTHYQQLAADPLLESPAHALLAAQVQQMFDKAGPMN